METPRELSSGDRLGATWLNRLVRFVRSQRINDGPGYRVKRGPNGVTLSFDTPKAVAAAAAAPRTPYWSFACTEDPDTHERTGGWFNCRLQIGYDRFPKDSDIQGLDSCEDGEYYVEVNTLTDAAEVKCVELDAAVPTTDAARSLVRIPIGRVEDAKLSGKPIDIIPVVYKYV